MYDTTSSVRNICGIIGLILHWFIYLPLMLYYFKKFYDSRNEIALQKRHVNICYITFIILFISIMIDRTCWWLFISQLFEPAIWIMLITYPPITLGIHYCMLFRFWMVKYDFEYSFISSNFQWQKLINPQFVTDYQLKTNWWFLNRHTFGNDLWLAKRLCIPFIIIVTISYITWGFAYIGWYHEIIPSLIDLLFIIIPMICCAVLYFKTPIIEDSFFIRSEMKLIFIVYGCLLLSYASWWILVVILKIKWWELIEAYTIVITHFSIFIIMTAWIKNKLKYASLDSNVHNNGGVTVKLPQILSNEHTFSTFMNHVMREWSIEILVSFVELTQYLQYLVDTNNSLRNKFKNYDMYKIRFPLTVPKTSLIADNAATTDAKQIGLKLYDKYLNSSSNLCINISYDLNMRVWNCLNKKNTQYPTNNTLKKISSVEISFDEHDDEYAELFSLFDEIRTEMYSLLRYSFTRFKKTNEYYKIVESKDEIC